MTKHLAALMRIVTSLCNPPERIELSCLSGECYRNAALLLLGMQCSFSCYFQVTSSAAGAVKKVEATPSLPRYRRDAKI